MKRLIWRNRILAGIGLGALVVYVLACTSFSPDDSKVLFPAFGPRMGSQAIAMFNRKTKTTDTVFVLSSPRAPMEEGFALRPQWTSDGKQILVAWGGEEKKDELNVAVVPVEGRGPTRLFRLAGVPEATQRLMLPLVAMGPYLFVTGESNRLVRLDLGTGETRTNTYQGELALFPSPDGDAVHYVGKGTHGGDDLELGRVDPMKLTLETSVSLTSIGLDADPDDVQLTFGRGGNWAVIKEGEGHRWECWRFEGKKLAKKQTFAPANEHERFGVMQLSADARTLYSSYGIARPDHKGYEFGLWEMSLADGSMRRTPLIQGAEGSVDEADPLLFTFGLSHDGKMAAVASTYLAYSRGLKLKSEAMALFLVDISGVSRKVLRVPVAVPPGFADRLQ